MDGFQIYQQDSSGAWPLVGSTAASDLSFTVTGLAPTTTFYYQVAAYNAAGTTWSTGAWPVTTLAAPSPPNSPTNLSASNVQSTSYQANWSYSGPAVDGFQIFQQNSQGAWPQVGTASASATSFIVTGLSPGTTYYFQVAAYNAVGDIWATAPGRADTVASVPIPLAVPYITQYQNLSTSDCDCGPAAVAMVVKYYDEGYPLGISSDAQLVGQARSYTGNLGACSSTNTSADTTFPQLEVALQAFGLTYTEISQSLSPAPTAQMQVMETATNAGEPVIALIHGDDLGRGTAYGDHWVVVTGFSVDGQTVYLNDPDNQSAKLPGWIVGGQMTLPYSTFSQAAFDAASGPYGMIILSSSAHAPRRRH